MDGTTQTNSDIKDKEQAENTETPGGLSEGLKPDKIADMVVGIIAPMIENNEKKRQFEIDYRMQTIPVMEFIEVEDLTKGMSAGEVPEWVRWTILFLIVVVPALIGMNKYTNVLDKFKPKKKSKRKKEREKDKKQLEKQENAGKEE